MNGNEVNGVSDAITTIDGQQAAVDAKYVDWDRSIYNPNGPVMDQPWGINAVDQMIKQAQAYGNAFPGARRVAEHLEIPYYVVNQEERFERNVVRPFCG